MGRARPRRPHVQRRQDLPRAARRRRAAAGPAARRGRARLGAPARDRLRRQRAQPRRHLGAPADADERVGRHVVRPARHRRPLAQGRAGPASARGTEGRRAAAARAGQLLGIQRRPHQPARARAAAPVPPAAARGLRRARARAARRRRRLRLAGLRRCLDRSSRRRPRPLGSGRIALGRRRLDQRARPGAHRPAPPRRRGRRRPPADRERMDRAHVRALRDRAVLRPASLAEPRTAAPSRECRRGPRSWSARAAITSAWTPSSTP